MFSQALPGAAVSGSRAGREEGVMESLAERKKALRRRMRGVRAEIFSDPEEHARLSLMILRRVMADPAWARSGSILLYAAFRDEVDTAWLLEQAWLERKTVALPRCRPGKGNGDPGGMDFVICRGQQDLEPSAPGIPEPSPRLPLWRASGEPALMLMPGLAFDRRGGRLGYGGGFYDRWLEQREAEERAARGTQGSFGCLLTLGLCFSAQVVDEVPRGAWDKSVRGICTEQEILWL